MAPSPTLGRRAIAFSLRGILLIIISNMGIRRFFINPDFIQGENIAVSDKNLISQFKNVLRFKTGDKVIFLDGAGKEYEAAIESLSDSVIKARIVGVLENQNEPELKITLCQSLCKKDKFEWILQKGTEIGISAFAPLVAGRSEKLGLNRERAEKILKEAAEQSERGIIPELLEIQDFEKVIYGSGTSIILDRSGESIKAFRLSLSTFHLNVFVGPEGGWTEDELKAARDKGIRIISLGPRVLRTETAGLVAAATLLSH